MKLIWQNNYASITCFSSLFSPFASTCRDFIQKHQAFEVSTKIASQGCGLWKYLFLRLTVGSLSCLLAFLTSGRSFHKKSRVTCKSCRAWSNLWNRRVIMCLRWLSTITWLSLCQWNERMVGTIFQSLTQFVPSLDDAYAHLIPMFPRTDVTSKQGHSSKLIYILHKT